MTPLPPAGDVIKVNLHWRVDGDLLAQTIHFFSYSGGAPSEADLGSLAGQIVTFADSWFGPLMPATWGMDSAMCTDLSSDMGAQSSGGTPWLGGSSAAKLSPGTCTLVNHQQTRRYRGGKPRTYLPVNVQTDLATAGTWTTSHVTAVDSAWGSFIGDILGTLIGGTTVQQLVNVSYYGPPNRQITGSTGRVRTVSTMRTTPLVTTITGHTTSQMVASQRRRNRDA